MVWNKKNQKNKKTKKLGLSALALTTVATPAIFLTSCGLDVAGNKPSIKAVDQASLRKQYIQKVSNVTDTTAETWVASSTPTEITWTLKKSKTGEVGETIVVPVKKQEVVVAKQETTQSTNTQAQKETIAWTDATEHSKFITPWTDATTPSKFITPWTDATTPSKFITSWTALQTPNKVAWTSLNASKRVIKWTDLSASTQASNVNITVPSDWLHVQAADVSTVAKNNVASFESSPAAEKHFASQNTNPGQRQDAALDLSNVPNEEIAWTDVNASTNVKHVAWTDLTPSKKTVAWTNLNPASYATAQSNTVQIVQEEEQIILELPKRIVEVASQSPVSVVWANGADNASSADNDQVSGLSVLMPSSNDSAIDTSSDLSDRSSNGRISVSNSIQQRIDSLLEIPQPTIYDTKKLEVLNAIHEVVKTTETAIDTVSAAIGTYDWAKYTEEQKAQQEAMLKPTETVDQSQSTSNVSQIGDIDITNIKVPENTTVNDVVKPATDVTTNQPDVLPWTNIGESIHDAGKLTMDVELPAYQKVKDSYYAIKDITAFERAAGTPEGAIPKKLLIHVLAIRDNVRIMGFHKSWQQYLTDEFRDDLSWLPKADWDQMMAHIEISWTNLDESIRDASKVNGDIQNVSYPKAFKAYKEIESIINTETAAGSSDMVIATKMLDAVRRLKEAMRELGYHTKTWQEFIDDYYNNHTLKIPNVNWDLFLRTHQDTTTIAWTNVDVSIYDATKLNFDQIDRGYEKAFRAYKQIEAIINTEKAAGATTDEIAFKMLEPARTLRDAVRELGYHKTWQAFIADYYNDHTIQIPQVDWDEYFRIHPAPVKWTNIGESIHDAGKLTRDVELVAYQKAKDAYLQMKSIISSERYLGVTDNQIADRILDKALIIRDNIRIMGFHKSWQQYISDEFRDDLSQIPNVNWDEKFAHITLHWTNLGDSIKDATKITGDEINAGYDKAFKAYKQIQAIITSQQNAGSSNEEIALTMLETVRTLRDAVRELGYHKTWQAFIADYYNDHTIQIPQVDWDYLLGRA